ncbi:glycosyltransferase [Frankia sp. Mgl5]|uniref:glycosyltransferase n=1 Tax=Frankia sp. Mgl5 TaxID=2933793 RepID=UPI00200F4844|nr:glycosyltransferase [Frankia sp. Mgl5]MCK9930636.1 glycosyltransferase [Frankia sp. Mgl5]
MARVMFVVPPLAGHVHPAVAVAEELAARGHQVAVAGHADAVAPMVPADVDLLALPGGRADDAAERIRMEAASQRLRGVAALKFLWQDFLLPLGAAMIPQIDALVSEFRPDVVVADQQAVGASVVARRRGTPLAVLATTPAEFDNPYAGFDRVGSWIAELLADFQLAHGISTEQAAATDPRFSDQLTIVCSVPGLLEASRFAESMVFVGCAAGRRHGDPDFPWTWLDESRATVLVSLGTVTRDAGRRFLRAAAEAVRSMATDVQAVMVAPPGTADDLAREAPADLLVTPRVPQLALLPHLAAVVCHAGNNTVCESLAHGVPLVVAPVRDDQPIIARQVVQAGAGTRIRFGRAGAATIADALRKVLDDPTYRTAATRLRGQFAAAGGAAAAAAHIEKLAS